MEAFEEYEDYRSFDCARAEWDLRSLGAEDAADVWRWNEESGELDARMSSYGLDPDDYRDFV